MAAFDVSQANESRVLSAVLRGAVWRDRWDMMTDMLRNTPGLPRSILEPILLNRF